MHMAMNDNIFDSRAIRRADCYAQRFMRAGTYHYNILPSHAAQISDDRPFVINVKDTKSKKGKMGQHNVFIKAQRAKYVPDNRELTIAVGDLVLWNCPGGNCQPFSVIGDQDFFDSARLTNECGYSHAFGTPGEYVWRDAYGSGLSGVVRVSDPECKCDEDIKAWRAKLAEGTVVMIADGKAKPSEVSVVVGQTVFFSVVTSKGISITDERYLEREEKATGKAE